jgi:predicted alpha/beta-hydrolase family hydrolase
MERYPAGGLAPTLVFAHGAGAGERHPWMLRVAAGLAARGVSVVTFEFPYMQAKRGRPDPAAVLERTFADVWHEIAGATHGPALFAGGKSMGGRIASQAAASGALAPSPAGLVFFGYPLHPPGAAAKRRDSHLPAVRAPMLFVHGTRDPFGAEDEMTSLAAALPATLHLVRGGDHSLATTRRDDRDGKGLADAMDVAARWMLEQSAPTR